MCGLEAIGRGMADGFGGLVIGVCRHILMRFGFAAIGEGDRMVGTEDRDIGDDSILLSSFTFTFCGSAKSGHVKLDSGNLKPSLRAIGG